MKKKQNPEIVKLELTELEIEHLLGLLRFDIEFTIECYPENKEDLELSEIIKKKLMMAAMP